MSISTIWQNLPHKEVIFSQEDLKIIKRKTH